MEAQIRKMEMDIKKRNEAIKAYNKIINKMQSGQVDFVSSNF